MCLEAKQADSGAVQDRVDESVSLLPFGPFMRAIVKLNRKNELHRARLAEDKVQVLLRYRSAKPPLPIRLRTGDDIRKPHLAHDVKAAGDGFTERTEERGLARRQERLSASIRHRVVW